MTIIPLDIGHGPHGFEDHSFSVLPFLGTSVVVILLLGLAALYLWRQGKLPLPALGRPRSPEDEAKQILAERFARGDIDSDDFMERASMLNWTPGAQPVPTRPRKLRP